MYHNARVAVLVGLALVAAGLTGCPAQKDAISVSQTSYDFGTSRLPWGFQVWNSNPSVAKLSFNISSSETWLHCDPASGTSTGASDKRAISVWVDRYELPAGTYSAYLQISAKGIKPVRVDISVRSDGSELGDNLKITDVTHYYSEPYLLDFTFSLRDKYDNPVIGEPGQFGVACRENAVPVGTAEAPPHFTRASSKQAKFVVVLDYTASMASIEQNGDADLDGISDAVEAMESAVKTVLLPALSADAQVAVYEFHRETDPQMVVEFSVDKEFVANRISDIWEEYVKPFWGVSRCYDALYAALEEFGQDHQNDETRNVIVISDGGDTSSLNSVDDVVDYALEQSARVSCVRVGAGAKAAGLSSIAAQTRGEYYGAASVGDIAVGMQRILDAFEGQYTLRWATLARTNVQIVPSFTLSLAGHSASYTSDQKFRVTDYAGDDLVGGLRVVPSRSGNKSTYFLRATYIPRYIWQLRFYVESPYAMTISKAATDEGGLCGNWSLSVAKDEVRNGTWIYLESPNPFQIGTAAPFAAFGPILRFDSDTLIDEDVDPFETLYVDNDLYTGGQAFFVEGYDNVLP